MNIIDFRNFFTDAPESASKFFSFIFRPGLFREFYTSKDYESISHMIRRLLEPHSKYGSNLKLFCSCVDRNVFYELCISLEEKKRTMSDEKMMEDILGKISSELSKSSKLLYTLKLLQKNKDKKYSAEIFLMLGILYSIFGEFYYHFENLYDISDTEAYEKIYKDIITEKDFTDDERKISGERATCFTDNTISDFLDMNICPERSEIQIASLTGEFIISRDTINKIVPFLRDGGKMKVILTDPQISDSIIEKMDTADNCLINTDYIMSVWKKLAEKYGAELYITDVPIFHNIICIDNNDMHVFFYTFLEKNGFSKPQLELKKGDEFFEMFKNELELFKHNGKQVKIIDNPVKVGA